MNERLLPMLVAMGAICVLSSWPNSLAEGGPVVFTASEESADELRPAVDAFRAAVGPLNPNLPISFSNGRREIDWDAVPDSFAAPFDFPGDFFTQDFAPRARGISFSTDGTGFQVSADSSNPTDTPPLFGNLQPEFPSEFEVFSPERLFSPLGSTLTYVRFSVPGSPATPATVHAFGAVFTGVEVNNESEMTFIDENGVEILRQFIPIRPPTGRGLSFFGVLFDDGERISQVVIHSGDAILDVHASDNAAMDDFIYSEPAGALPEPAGQVLFLSGAIGVAVASVVRRSRIGRSRLASEEPDA